MTPVGYIALWGILPVGVALFWLIPPRRALIAVLLLGWLFLPMAGVSFPGFPDYTKATATSLAALLGVTLRDSGRLMAFRARWFDLPMLAWCLVPVVTSMTNDLGIYDGLSSVLGTTLDWGVPYLLGRVYFTNMSELTELAIGIVIGGLVYVPLCWIEIRLSPQLHYWVYGFHQHQFAQTRRYGGFRPMVFMYHGLAVGMWMTAATLTAVWLGATGAVRRLCGAPMWVWAVVLAVTSLFVKSFGAFALLIIGCGTLLTSRTGLSRTILAAIVALPVLYAGVRATGRWDGSDLVELSSALGGEKRGGSLRFRMDMENVLIERALEQPLFGWGGWGRNRPIEDRSGVVTDGLWIISMGQHGIVGLVSIMGVLLVGPLLLIRYARSADWLQPRWAGASALAVLLALFMIDCLFNACPNPLFTLACGGVPTAMVAEVRQRTAGGKRSVAVQRGVICRGRHRTVATRSMSTSDVNAPHERIA